MFTPAVRKSIYAVLSAIGALLTVLGVATPEQVDTWLQVLSTLLLAVFGLMATLNTHPDKPEQPAVQEGADRSGQAPGE